MIELAIDVGSGVTKLCSADRKTHFPSLSGQGPERGFDLEESKSKNTTVSFRVRRPTDIAGGKNRHEEVFFAVGEAAPNLVSPEKLAQTRSDDWYASDEYLALMFAAVAEGVAPQYRGKIRLCTGLPQALYGEHRDALTKRLIGTHCFKVNDIPYKITIRREDLFVMPQVMGLFLSRLAENRSLQKDRVAVLDVGTYTSDWTIVENLATVQWASGGMAVGVSNVVEDISKYLENVYRAQCSYVAVSNAIRYGEILIKERRVDLRDHIRQSVHDIAGPLVDAVYKQWRGAPDAHVIVGGGGARLFGPTVRTLIPHTTVIQDAEPIYSVVEGYYSYLTAVRRKPKAA